MADIVNIFFILLIILFSLSLSFGVNLKKIFGWIQIFSSFLLGVLVGTGRGWFTSLITGALFTILMLSVGPYIWNRRNKIGK